MRTTVRIDDALLSEAKQLAARTGRTLTSLIEDALRQSLATARRPGSRGGRNLLTFGEGGVQAGVDLDDTAALLNLMDAGE
jgi:hypothetical protein